MILPALLAAALLASGFTQDAPRVSARLSATTVGIGEPVIFEIVVEGGSDDIAIGAPAFPPGLALQGTQDFTEMHFSLPGGRKQTRRREFALYATAPGRLRIPPVTITIGNTSYRTNAVELQVSGVAAPRSVESTDDAWLRATMQPETVYVGQQSTLTVEAGFSEEVRSRLTRPPVFDTPSPTGFWVQDVPGGVQAHLRNIDGRMFEVQTVQRAYFPLSAGSFAFAPARAVIDVREGFLFAPETREIRSKSPKVVVLPLPEAGRPPDYRGAVGSYSVRAFLQPDTVSAGEAVQITVEITGHGNLKAAPPPPLPTIAGVEQFTPTEDASLAFDGAVVQGTKRFQWVVIPERAGTIEVPAVSYAFFEPATRTYRRAASKPLALVVLPTTASGDDASTGVAALRAARTRPQPAPLRWVRSRGFLVAQLVPVALLVALLLGQRLRRGRSRAALLMLELRRVAAAHSPFPEFLRDVESIMRAAVAERTGDAAARTAEVHAVGATLRRADVAEDIAARVVALIDRLETQRFAPAAAEAAERKALLIEAEELLRRLQRRTAQGPRAALAMLAVLQIGGSAPFERGVELYGGGHFREAASTFESVVAVDSTDIAAWSNLGNAYYRSGERGRAIWAWARAARAAPRDGAIIRNLQAAGAIEVLRTRPPLSVRPVEWYLLAAVAWWLAVALVMVAVVRRKRHLLSWALPALAAMVVALLVGIIADGRAYAVAISEETRLYGDPTVHSPVVRTVQSGAGLDVLEQRGDWLRVRTVTQAEGWVEEDAVGLL
jgi:tetratricopeptide (TPR) repeat protein